MKNTRYTNPERGGRQIRQSSGHKVRQKRIRRATYKLYKQRFGTREISDELHSVLSRSKPTKFHHLFPMLFLLFPVSRSNPP
jgi:zona occludens toxin (predicted ATPase)